MTVTVYTQTGCSPCKLFKMWLKHNNISYQEKNITEHETYLQEFRHYGASGIPYTIIHQQDEERAYVGATPKLKKALKQMSHSLS
ncbi:glutaredoxin family protein [Salicibibacter cibarius]|uniref:Glutaredoxin family protein n=1 Tax=Salicibibacter cibarius TaxID=2743000 RepID=A0A7T7CDG0_9BACI|nr:glutaredoxin family protein [Salicibibacter cibarius]QQK77930.1 glutaredoxin family protein [Salicibibacter cibarius]